MAATLLSILRPLAPYLAAVGILLAGGVYIVVLRHELQTADQKNLTLAAVNAEDVAAIASYKAQQAKWNTALQALDAQTLASRTATQTIVTNIDAASKGEDGPVAPVLAKTLDSLRALQGGAP